MKLLPHQRVYVYVSVLYFVFLVTLILTSNNRSIQDASYDQVRENIENEVFDDIPAMSHEDISDLHKELCGDNNKRTPQFLGDCD